MFDPDKPFTFDSFVRLLLAVALVVALIWLLGYLSSVLVPFVAALLLAYLLNPVTCLIQRLVKSRGLAVTLTLVGLLCVGGLFVLVVVPRVGAEFAHMGRVLADLVNNGEMAKRISARLPPDLWEWVRRTASSPELRDLFSSDGATSVAQRVMDTLVPGIRGLAKGTASFVSGFLGLAVILLYLIFLLADFGRIRDNWQNYLPGRIRGPAVEFLNDFATTMSRYFRSQVVIALCVGVLMSIGFLLIGLPLAIVMGMTIGILNIAPYLGALGIVPVVFLAALNSVDAGGSAWVGVALAVGVMAVVQVIQDTVLVPKIQGKSLGLSPWLILLALSVWGKLLGFLGLLIALPMTCLCLSYYRRLLAKNR